MPYEEIRNIAFRKCSDVLTLIPFLSFLLILILEIDGVLTPILDFKLIHDIIQLTLFNKNVNNKYTIKEKLKFFML